MNCAFCDEEMVEFPLLSGLFTHVGFLNTEPGDQESSYCRRKLAAKLKELTPETIQDKLFLAKKLKDEIFDYISVTFPSGSKVRVDCERFRGFGVVDFYGEDTPFDKVPVKLENGNVWLYSVLDCKCV